MDKYEEVVASIREMAVNTILVLMDTGISESAFLNASYNIDTYQERQVEKCGWFKNSPGCLSKVKAITKETLEGIVVRSAEILDEGEFQETVRKLARVYEIVDLRK